MVTCDEPSDAMGNPCSTWLALWWCFLSKLLGSVAKHFSQQRLADHKSPKKELHGYALLLAMPSREFEALAAFPR